MPSTIFRQLRTTTQSGKTSRGTCLENSSQQIEPEKLYHPSLRPASTLTALFVRLSNFSVIRNFTVSNSTVIRLDLTPSFTDYRPQSCISSMFSVQCNAATTFPKVRALLSDFFSTLGSSTGANKQRAHTPSHFSVAFLPSVSQWRSVFAT